MINNWVIEREKIGGEKGIVEGGGGDSGGWKEYPFLSTDIHEYNALVWKVIILLMWHGFLKIIEVIFIVLIAIKDVRIFKCLLL